MKHFLLTILTYLLLSCARSNQTLIDEEVANYRALTLRNRQIEAECAQRDAMKQYIRIDSLCVQRDSLLNYFIY